MTANHAGKHAVGSFWVTLKRMREYWVLIAFLATSLYWARDVYEEFMFMPRRVDALDIAVRDLADDIAQLAETGADPVADHRRVLSFPGLRHGVEDGGAGERVTVRLSPVLMHRPECRPGAVAAWMIDAAGRWFSVKTDLSGWPSTDGPQELAFGVEVHPRMAVGRARFLLQIFHHCGDRLLVERAPYLHFRVLPDGRD